MENEKHICKVVFNKSTSLYEATYSAYPNITGYGETSAQAYDNLIFILGFM